MFQFSGRLSALRHRDYFRYWTGSFASVGATQLQVMAQGWLIFEITQSPIVLGYLGAATAIPAIVMTLFGGALADRLNKKHVLMVTSLSVAVLMAVQAWLDASGDVEAWHIILIAGLVSFITGFDWPTRQAIFPALIHRDDMMSAVALNSIVWQSSRMVVPALGGIAIGVADTWLVFLFCSIGFLAMFFVVMGLKVDLPKATLSGSTFQQVSEGLHFILHNRVFLLLISLTYAIMFFGWAHIQLMPAFVALLQASEQGYGLLLSATGVGSVAGTLVIGSYQNSPVLGRIILGSSFISGLWVYIFAFTTNFAELIPGTFAIAMFAATLASMFASMFLISSMTVLQLQVPDELRGRVMGFHGITFSLMPLGGLLAGWVAGITSVPVAIGVSVSIYLVIVIVIAATQKEVRGISSHTASPQAGLS